MNPTWSAAGFLQYTKEKVQESERTNRARKTDLFFNSFWTNHLIISLIQNRKWKQYTSIISWAFESLSFCLNKIPVYVLCWAKKAEKTVTFCLTRPVLFGRILEKKRLCHSAGSHICRETILRPRLDSMYCHFLHNLWHICITVTHLHITNSTHRGCGPTSMQNLCV